MAPPQKTEIYKKIVDNIEKEHKLPALGLNKSLISFYVKNLVRDGFVKKIGYGTYDVLKPYTTVKAPEKTTSSSIEWRGQLPQESEQSTGKFEFWNVGAKYAIKSAPPDFEFLPELKRQQGFKGQLWHGWIDGCFIQQGARTLRIVTKPIRGDNVWDVHGRGIGRILEVVNYVCKKYSLELEFIEMTSPDILLKDPMALKLAGETLKTMSRVRIEEVGLEVDMSKTGKPEMEARSPETADVVQNNLDFLKTIAKGDIGMQILEQQKLLSQNQVRTVEEVKKQTEVITQQTIQNAEYAKHLQSHIEAIQKLGTGVDNLIKAINIIPDKIGEAVAKIFEEKLPKKESIWKKLFK